jgi:hypothetical protein
MTPTFKVKSPGATIRGAERSISSHANKAVQRAPSFDGEIRTPDAIPAGMSASALATITERSDDFDNIDKTLST